jgi:CRISPR/Cas system CMR subunit Cmr4 (Cas7 group RAMP superfamily)
VREWLTALFAGPRVSVPVTVALIVVAVITTLVLTKRVQSPETANNAANANVVQVSSTNNSRASAGSQNTINSEPKSSSLRTQRARTGRYNERSVARASVSERQTPDQLVREAEKKYLSAIGLLVRDVSRRPSQLDTESRVKLDRALASIDRTIAATRHIVRKHPDDPVAAQYMLAAYARKVDTLRTLATGF